MEGGGGYLLLHDLVQAYPAALLAPDLRFGRTPLHMLCANTHLGCCLPHQVLGDEEVVIAPKTPFLQGEQQYNNVFSQHYTLVNTLSYTILHCPYYYTVHLSVYRWNGHLRRIDRLSST